MDFSDELLFFFSALGVFNAILISVYFFFFKKPKETSNYFFGFLLLMLAIRVAKSVVFYFDHDLAGIYIKIGLAALILIGPALYFYVLSVIRPNLVKLRWLVHLGTLALAQLCVGVCYSETFNPQFAGIYWLELIYVIWLVYILATIYLLRGQIGRLIARSKKLSGLDFWLISVLFGNLVIWTAYRTSTFTSYIVGAMSFSFILYLLILLVIYNRKKTAIFIPKEKYANKKIDTPEASEILTNLKELMVSDKRHRNPNLKLPDLAKLLNILPHTLSQLLNENLGKNFTNFVNEYRVEEAKSLILSNDKLTLEAIGYECGFNSKSTFYAAFKKFTGTTPAKFKENS